MVQCTQPPPQLKLPESNITELTDDENHDSPPEPEKWTRMHHIERHRSCVVTLSDIELNGLQPRHLLQTIEKSPSFKVHHRNPTQMTESLLADFAETAIGRVAPVDYGLWWIILLRAYTKWTGQRAMHLIHRLCLSEGCDTSPALLCADGCSMIDRRMGIYGYPFDFMASCGGYFIGNVSPARMDFRWFCLGNFIAILSSLATGEQAEAILDLVEEHWQGLIGEMPLKICYPAMENQEWQIVTGCDPKNTRWSYHNGGSWPVSVRLGRAHLVRIAVELMEQRVVKHLDEAIIDLVEKFWQKLICEMPLKVCYPTMENQEWQLAIGFESENARGTFHNDGSDHSFTTDEWEPVNFAKIFRRMRGLISIPKEPGNSAFISLDGEDEFLKTYMTAIGQIRQCCEEYGIRRDLSDIGRNVIVFTNPPQGTFYCNVLYRGRIIKVAIDLRTLYLRGWTGLHGTFDMKMSDEDKYMTGYPTFLAFKKNYRFLAPTKSGDNPSGQVKNVLIGLLAWQQAFEALYKADSESKPVRQGVATFAVHISEAARSQSIYKDICVITAEYTIDTLDSRTNLNSFWVNNYGHYGDEGMKRINSLLAGKVPAPIVQSEDAVKLEIKISLSEILKQIRIFPREEGGGVFKCLDPGPPIRSEADKLIKSRKPEEKSAKGWKDPRKGRGGGGGGGGGNEGEGGGGGGGGGGNEGLPALYLIEDWELEEEKEVQLQEEKEVQIQEENEPQAMNLCVQDFFDLFPGVQRIVTLQRKKLIPPTPVPPPAVRRIPSASLRSTPTIKALAPGAISGVKLLSPPAISGVKLLCPPAISGVKLLSPPAISGVKMLNPPAISKLASVTQKLLKHRWIKLFI